MNSWPLVNVPRQLRIAVGIALVAGSLLPLFSSPTRAASETACEKLREVADKLGCPGSGHPACPGLANALAKAGCAQFVNTENWLSFPPSSCAAGSQYYVFLSTAYDIDAISAAMNGKLLIEIQGTTWKPIFVGEGIFGTKVFRIGPDIAGSFVTGPGTLDCSQPLTANGLFIDLVAYVVL